MDAVHLWGSILGAIIMVIGYLLKRSNEDKDARIKTLFEIHEQDARELQVHKVEIAQNHYPKSEINMIMAEFKGYLNQRFDQLERKIDTKG